MVPGMTDPKRFMWERQTLKGHAPHYVLRYRREDMRDIWAALIYEDRPNHYVLRVFQPGNQYQVASSEPPRTPPGFDDLWSLPEDPRLQAHLHNVATVYGLPDDLLELPRYDERPPDPISVEEAEAEGYRVSFARLRAMLPDYLARFYSQHLRFRRYLRSLPSRKHWRDRYPSAANYLDRYIQREINRMDESCVDGRRAARVGDRAGMRAFDRSRTCCGSREWDVKVDGYVYRVGFNYGH